MTAPPAALPPVLQLEGVVKKYRRGDEQVNVLIEDQGAGFEIDKVAAMHSSTGLSAMRERVELLGGRLDIESKPGDGTKLMAEIPLGQLIVDS